MSRPQFFTIVLAVTFILQPGCVSHRPPDHVVTQASSYDSLYRALYDGTVSLQKLASDGDFGLGTIDGFNGEVVLLDGNFYSIFGDGSVLPITDLSVTTPFFELTHFHGDLSKPLPAGTRYTNLQGAPLDFLPSKNIIYAVKIEGVFQHVKTRSMPKQSKPYVSLTELQKHQPTFEFENTRGTMVGFWSPPSMKGVALAGWHLHFLTADHRGGGHVLEFTTQDAVMTMDECHDFRWVIPNSDDYRRTDFEAP